MKCPSCELIIDKPINKDKINNNNNNKLKIDDEIYFCIKKLNINKINEILFKKNIDIKYKIGNDVNSIIFNLKLLLNILNEIKIIKININSLYLYNNIKWIDIIKANIMEFACENCFDYNNFS